MMKLMSPEDFEARFRPLFRCPCGNGDHTQIKVDVNLVVTFDPGENGEIASTKWSKGDLVDHAKVCPRFDVEYFCLVCEEEFVAVLGLQDVPIGFLRGRNLDHFLLPA